MHGIPPTKKRWLEKLAIAAGLIFFSASLYTVAYLLFHDLESIKKYVVYHIPFLPIHALVLGIIIEEILAWRGKQEQKRKLNLFLGIFFRQMGVDFYVTMAEMVQNRDQLEELIMVGKDWDRRRIRKAQAAVRHFALRMNPDPELLARVFDILTEREHEIMDMTRNPNLWEFEEFYRALVALFHLIEESRFRGREKELSPAVREHLAGDVGKALKMLLGLWLRYLEFLKGSHPVLFSFQAGVHNTVEPLMLDDTWDQ